MPSSSMKVAKYRPSVPILATMVPSSCKQVK